MDKLVRDILTARVYDVAEVSQLERAPKLSAQAKVDVYLKREDLQATRSFKLRGAYNKMSRLTRRELEKGVIAASAGNHAQGVALAAQKLGTSALVIMPKTAPEIKVAAVKSLGATVELAGDSYSDAADYCKQRQQETGRTFIHPFDDPLVIAGQGTVGREVLEQLPGVTHIFVPVGGGGLIAGIAAYIKSLNPKITIVGVQTEEANTLGPLLHGDESITLNHVGIFSDGTAVKRLGDHTSRLIRQYVDESITVSTDQLCAAIKVIFEDTRSIVEPAGALAVAGIQHYELPPESKAVAICSGANLTFERLQQIAERTLFGSGKEALFAISMAEKPGALRKFCTDVLGARSIREFKYRHHDNAQASILLGVSTADEQDKQSFIAAMKQHGHIYTDLTFDDIAKEHVRHMIGGRSPSVQHEYIYSVEFPERPGALGDFLSDVGSKWNITLFHYKSAASDTGSVLIGFKTEDQQALEERMRLSGHRFNSVEAEKSIRIFTA